MQIPILNGIGKDWRRSYPVNMIPVPVPTGISAGYFRPSDGIIEFGTGPGIDRGGIQWNGVLYRVMGSDLCQISPAGTATIIGTIPGSDTVTMNYSFDRLSISASGQLYYYDGASLTKVSDPDLGTVIDHEWIDGYFLTTDGTSLVVTELIDPLQVNPLKYGSSEADPDQILALVKIRNEIYVLNRNTTEVFDNVGGEFFPLGRIEGAQIQKGCIGTHTCCRYMENLVFLGSGRNESPSIYIGSNGESIKLSTREIDEILLEYTEYQLSEALLETRNDRANQLLYVHLADKTLVYDGAASQVIGEPVWFILTSSTSGFSQYRARNLVWCYDKWISGDTTTSKLGYFTDDIGSHYGSKVRWEFQTSIIYNNSRGALLNELELVAITGDIAIGDDPSISTAYSIDGSTWSQEKYRSCGKIGDRRKRIVWYKQGNMRNWRIQRFSGDSSAHLHFGRLEAQIEPLGV